MRLYNFSTTESKESKQGIEYTGKKNEKLNISVLEEDIFHIQFLPSGKPKMDKTWMVCGPKQEVPYTGRDKNDYSGFSLPEVNWEKKEKEIVYKNSKLNLVIRTNPFHIEWQTTDGKCFASDLPLRSYAHDIETPDIYHFMRMFGNEFYYGFGERSGELEKTKKTMKCFNQDAACYNAEKTDPLYKHIPFYITWVPELKVAYGLFYDTTSTCYFDTGRDCHFDLKPYRTFHTENGDMDYYFLFGPTIQNVVEKFALLTGYIALPPKWSMGYLGSTMTYTDDPNAQEELLKFVKLCDKNDIPCDMFHLSSGYTTNPKDGKRYVFNWDLDKIPQPMNMVKGFYDAGIHLSANIKPCMLNTHHFFEEVKEIDGYLKSAEEDQPQLEMFFGGPEYGGGFGAFLDFTNPEVYEWWKAKVKEWLHEYGIESTWNDNNEYVLWDDQIKCNGFGKEIPLALVRSLHTYLMCQASYDATTEFELNKRPFTITRSTIAGMQRFVNQSWSGDNDSNWHTLKYNIPMGLGVSLSGFPNYGHDVGGFFGKKPDKELWVRWVQNGIMHPRFTIHSMHEDGSVNEPWMHPEVLPIVRDLIKFRYKLIPYFYSLLAECSETGHPIIRPMVYEFPNDEKCWKESFDFMLGKSILVASVYEQGAITRKVYLPKDNNWFDYNGKKWYKGGKEVELDAPLEKLPLLFKENSIIPMAKSMKHVGQQADDERTCYIFPSPKEGKGEFILYEDDGLSNEYKEGKYSKIFIETIASEKDIEIKISKMHEGYMLPYKQIDFILATNDSRSFNAKNIEKEWRDENGYRHVVIEI